ncbi:MAG: hypothetical protein QM578_12400 [Pantoea sp.]|uniref:hypothetical protein n=1 Tax=Pantoea sp. TaxID=69393 RepID=UPI0039E3349B
MQVSNEQLHVIALTIDSEVIKSIANELLNSRKEKENLGIYREIRPRFYPVFKVVFMGENKVCGYTLHTGRFSSFNRKNFDKNFIKR